MPEKDKSTLAFAETAESPKAPCQTSDTRDKVGTVLDGHTDYYLLHPPRQPKAEIAAYVESQGIAVPRRFDSLQEALDSGKPFIVRSEHPDEYTGISGLLKSPDVKPEEIAEVKGLMAEHPEYFEDKEELRSNLLFLRTFYDVLIIRYLQNGSQEEYEAELQTLRKKEIKKYCKSRKLSEEAFIRDISYAYWELLGGINRTIVADDAVEGRYHFFSSGENSTFQDYSIYDNGRLISMTPWMPEDLRADLDSITAFYEKVRRLPRFEVGQCPVMEMQTTGDRQNFFLQYHRMRNHNPARFCLERPCEEGETEAIFVRGATPPEGVTFPVIICGDDENTEGAHFQKLPGLGRVYDTKMRALLMHKRTTKKFAGTIGTRHMQVLKLFNPVISLVADDASLGVDFYEAEEEFEKTRKPVTIPIHIISDGRRAYLKIIRPL